jgi:hypothetical protein
LILQAQGGVMKMGRMMRSEAGHFVALDRHILAM